MVNKPRAIGTSGESAVVKAIRRLGFPHAERRALRGIQDAGDITGTPGVCWSVKSGHMAEKASDLDVTRWLAELETQRGHAKAEASVLVMKRKGISGDNADRWWAVMQMPVRTIEGRPTGHWVPCRMTLEQACMVLRLWGYGSEVAPGSPGEALGAPNGAQATTDQGDAA